MQVYSPKSASVQQSVCLAVDAAVQWEMNKIAACIIDSLFLVELTVVWQPVLWKSDTYRDMVSPWNTRLQRQLYCALFLRKLR